LSEIKRQLTSLIIDRSGSINGCLSDMQGAVDNFIKERKSDSTTSEELSISQFDSDYELVKGFTELSEYAHEKGGSGFYFRIKPRGRTALYDAIGRNISYVEDFVSRNDKSDNTIKNIVIVTDGLENASSEYTRNAITRLVENKTADHWNFIYLGANQDAVYTGQTIGISPDLSISYDTRNSGLAMAAVSSVLTRGASGGAYSFSEKERSSSVGS
jgi:hypothetical protein